MVNTDKWEKISKDDIKSGDKLLLVEKEKDSTLHGRYTAHRKDGWGDWLTKEGIELFDYFNEDSAVVYRRKPKVYKPKAKFGTAITATTINPHTDDVRIKFVCISEEDLGQWRTPSGNVYTTNGLIRGFRDFELINKGL